MKRIDFYVILFEQTGLALCLALWNWVSALVNEWYRTTSVKLLIRKCGSWKKYHLKEATSTDNCKAALQGLFICILMQEKFHTTELTNLELGICWRWEDADMTGVTDIHTYVACTTRVYTWDWKTLFSILLPIMVNILYRAKHQY